MKLLILIIALCSASSLYGQTKQPPPMKTKAVLKAEADLRVVTAERDRLAEQRDSWIENLKSEQSTSARLQKENDTLSVNAAYRLGLLVILDKEIRGIPLNENDRSVTQASETDQVALNTAAGIEKNVNDGLGVIKTLADTAAKLTDRYNSLLGDYKDYVVRTELRLQSVRQGRLANGLAAYSAMPRYTPPSKPI